MKKRKTFKYNEDDILEILTEYLAEKEGFGTFSSRAILLGEPGKDLRLVAVIGDLSDNKVNSIDLEELDSNMDFNGDHTEDSYIDAEEFLKIFARKSNETFAKIKAIVNVHDPLDMGELSGDEYDNSVSRLTKLFLKGDSPSELAKIIRLEYPEWFASYTAKADTRFLKLARQLWKIRQDLF